MKLNIDTNELTEQKGTWIASVSYLKHDGGKVGTPGAVKYGSSKEQAYEKLKQLLIEKGHEVIN